MLKLNKRIIIKYYKRNFKYKNLDKENELLINNYDIIEEVLKKINKYNAIYNKDINNLLEKNNYYLNKKQDSKLLNNINFLLLKKLIDIIIYENKKINDLEKIKKACNKIKQKKDISINKYYQINEDTSSYSIYFLINEIKNFKNKYKLLDVINLSLKCQNKNIAQLLEEYNVSIAKNTLVINNILKSFIYINDLSSKLKEISTYKKTFTRATIPKNINIISNKEYSILLDNYGNITSKYKNVIISRYNYNINNLFIYDLSNKEKISILSYDKNYKYQNTYNEAIAKYVKRNDDIRITTEVTVSQIENIEVKKISINNITSESKKFKININIPLIFEIDNQYKYTLSKNLNTKYSKNLNSFITYQEKLKIYLINRIYNINNLHYTIENDYIKLDAIIEIEKNKKKAFYIITEICKDKNEIFRLHNKYKNEMLINQNIFFLANTIKNNIKPEKILLYNNIINSIYNDKYKIDENKLKIIKENKLNINSLWKYGISGNYKIIIIDIDDYYDFFLIEEFLIFYIYLKMNGIYIDTIFMYTTQNKRLYKDIKIIEKYLNTIFNYKNLPGEIYIIEQKILNFDEINLFNMLSKLKINAKSFHSLKDAFNNINKENKNKTIIQDFEEFIKHELAIKKENNYIYDIYSDNEVNQKIINTECSAIKIIDPKQLTFFNSFGGFYENGYKYIITNNHLSWKNIIANKYLTSIISNKSNDYIFSKDYILTKNQRKCIYNEILLDNKKISFDNITYSMGYVVKEKNTEELNIKITNFISIIDNIEFLKINLKNITDNSININLKYLLYPLLDTNNNNNNFIYSKYDYDKNIIILQNRLSNYKLFITATLEFNNIYLEKFKQKVLEFELTIEKGQKKEFAIMIGTISSSYNNIYLLKEKYSTISVIDNSLDIVKKSWNNTLNIININTEDLSFNYISKWIVYEILVSSDYDIENIYNYNFSIEIENVLKNSLNLMMILPNIVREKIINCSKYIIADGNILKIVNKFQNTGIISSSINEKLLLLYTIEKYLKTTEDKDILSEDINYVIVKYTDDNEVYYKSSKYNDSLYSHIEKVIDNIISNKECYNKILLYKAISIFIEITKYYDKNKDNKKYRELLKYIKKEITENKNDLFYRILFDLKYDDNIDINDILKAKENILLKIIVLIKINKVDEAYKYYQNLNPIIKTNNKRKALKYNKEPYLLNKSSIYYMIGLELFLGFQKQGKKLFIRPNLPSYVNNYNLTYKYLNTSYNIKVKKTNKKSYIKIDDLLTEYIILKNDYKEHDVEIAIN